MSLHWTEKGMASDLARAMRAATRRKPEIDGHTFTYTDLKKLYATEDETVAVLTHETDKVWQHWVSTPTGGWFPKGMYRTKGAAMEAAEALATAPTVIPGRYLLARFGKRPWMRVRIDSKSGMELIGGIFERMDAEVSSELVNA